MAEEYSIDLQRLFLEFMLADHDLYVRTSAITKPDYYDRQLRATVRFIQEHVDKYNDMPTRQQLQAKTGLDLTDVGSNANSHKKWFLDEYEKFCRHKAIELAILASTDKLERKEYGAVEQLIKDAVSIGLAKEQGIEYWADPAARIRLVQEQRGGISTGWKTVDDILYGGFNRGELNIFAAPSGHGKSLTLQNLALNWALAGLNVVYISLELSEQLCSIRMDSMLTRMGTRDVFKNVEDVALKLGMISKRAGRLHIVQLPNGITVHDLRAYLKEYQIQNDIQVDAVLVDYLDLMFPASKKVSLENLFIKDKIVSEELRNFAIDGNYLLSSASQINREGGDAPEFTHSHISGGISKINTGDNVIGIKASESMKENGMIQFQFMKTRSSAGVGKRLDMSYDQTCMRIEDMSDEYHQQQKDSNEKPSSMMEKLKSRQPDNANEIDSPVEQKVDLDRLKSILKRKI